MRRFLPPREWPWYSLDRRLGGPQNRSGRCGEEKHLAPAGNPTPAVQPVARRDATNLAWDLTAFHRFPQSTQANSWIIPRFGHERFLLNHFQFVLHQSYNHSTPCSLDTGSVVNEATVIMTEVTDSVHHTCAVLNESIRGSSLWSLPYSRLRSKHHTTSTHNLNLLNVWYVPI
jgi:hypothetical protein